MSVIQGCIMDKPTYQISRASAVHVDIRRQEQRSQSAQEGVRCCQVARLLLCDLVIRGNRAECGGNHASTDCEAVISIHWSHHGNWRPTLDDECQQAE
jgi:hypothetical protein